MYVPSKICQLKYIHIYLEIYKNIQKYISNLILYNNNKYKKYIFQLLESKNIYQSQQMHTHPQHPQKKNQPKFTFTTQLTKSIKSIQQKDNIQQQIIHKPIINEIKIQGNIRQCMNNLVCCYQSRDFLIYAIISWQNKLASNLVLVYFSKAKGQNQSKIIQCIKGRIVSMEFIYPQQVIRQNNLLCYQTKLVMGNQDGFIKILDFKNKNDIESYQIDTKAIVDIKVPPPQYFYDHPIVFALLEDYSVYVFSVKQKNVLAHFRPTIMMCDVGLNLSLHSSMKYLLQSTQGGYLVLWKINQNLFKRLNPQNPTSKSHQKIYNVFPTCILHSASIDGIKWSSFLGDFIAIITLKGVFKIIALNIQEKQQFAIILQYQIQNGDRIKDAKLLPKQQCLIVVKQISAMESAIQCIFYTPQLMVRNILRVKVPTMPSIHGIVLSKNYRYVFLRNGTQFFITYTKIIEEKIAQNRKHNDNLRELQY